MSLRWFLGRSLLGAALGAALAGGVAWAAGSPASDRWWPVLSVAALLGAGAAWWLDRCYRSPQRWLRQRVERLSVGDPGPSPVPPAGAADLSAAIDRFAEARDRRAARSERQRRHLEEILESMSDGVLVTDREQRVELVTPAFRAQFAARDSRPGQSVLELSRSPALAGFLERLQDAEEIAEQRIDSEARRVLELRGRRLPGDRWVVVARDVTEPLRLDETRRDLVANVSHELRTPLTAIRGYAENLREGALDEPKIAARFVDRVLAQCQRLEALLEDLLALSRLEKAEEAPAADAAIDLVSLVERSLETVRGLAAERQVALHFDSRPVPIFPGSEEALDRQLLNLLENAIKYNRRDGTVTVEVAPRGDEVALTVADTGIGVPRRDLRRIFERFYRVDSGRSREEGGTGLGLAIVKHAAQLHGGRVEVESELGRGTVFRVYLPLPS